MAGCFELPPTVQNSIHSTIWVHTNTPISDWLWFWSWSWFCTWFLRLGLTMKTDRRSNKWESMGTWRKNHGSDIEGCFRNRWLLENCGNSAQKVLLLLICWCLYFHGFIVLQGSFLFVLSISGWQDMIESIGGRPTRLWYCWNTF